MSADGYPPAETYSAVREHLIRSGVIVPAEQASGAARSSESWWLAAQPCLRLAPGEREQFEARARTAWEIS